MTPGESELRRVLDQMAIRDLHARYFQGCDRHSAALIRSCFAQDQEARYPGGRAVRGLDEFMSVVFGPYLDKRGSYENVKSSNHFMGNLSFDSLECDAARTETYALISRNRGQTPISGPRYPALRRLLHHQPHRQSGLRGDIDQGVEAEEIDSPFEHCI